MIVTGKLLLFGLLLVVVVCASVVVIVVGGAATARAKLRGTKSAFAAHISLLSLPSVFQGVGRKKREEREGEDFGKRFRHTSAGGK